eukprot:Protomagalhaensia_wolfi_Nauph_80__6283@NODE_964_length_1849_cov_62_549171_g729_i0_p1_GENE_NODE_964_length_1849_cov_62_549171_g729_i0NODE_964_length_1849_cov_62_549171_g729_i0_p1_ORF_typecomplete_len327_score32_24Glu_cyclase_2/PF05096_12/2e36SGL/PF08450_12/1_5_NODE_964_length_1849_cov_62_549171_g729_i04621442
MLVIQGALVLLSLELAWAKLLVKEATTAFFEHRSQPFTQGLHAVIKGPNTGGLLDSCVSAGDAVATCFEKVLKERVKLYESSGLYNESYVQLIEDFTTGTPSIRTLIPGFVFAEGLTVLEDGTLLLGTWKENRLLVLREGTNKAGTRYIHYVDEFYVEVPEEIWGLTHNTTHLFMTSGDPYLYVFEIPLQGPKGEAHSIIDGKKRNIQALKYTKKIPFTLNKHLISNVNEIAYNSWTGTLFGNIWMQDGIFEFNPTTGECIDILPLKQASTSLKFKDEPRSSSRMTRGNRKDSNKVWNGITFVARDWMLFTGKLFDYVYLAKLHRD